MAIIGGALSYGTTQFSNQIARDKANQLSLQESRRQFDSSLDWSKESFAQQMSFARDEAEKNRQFQLDSDSTKYQRMVQDYLRAGLNPSAIGQTGGLSGATASVGSPTGVAMSSPSLSSYEMSSPSFDSLKSMIDGSYQSERNNLDLRKLNSEIDNLRKQGVGQDYLNTISDLSAQLKAMTLDDEIQNSTLNNELIKAEIENYNQSVISQQTDQLVKRIGAILNISADSREWQRLQADCQHFMLDFHERVREFNERLSFDKTKTWNDQFLAGSVLEEDKAQFRQLCSQWAKEFEHKLAYDARHLDIEERNSLSSVLTSVGISVGAMFIPGGNLLKRGYGLLRGMRAASKAAKAAKTASNVAKSAPLKGTPLRPRSDFNSDAVYNAYRNTWLKHNQ